MSVTIITGNIGSGKTDLCIDEIRKKHNENFSHRCVMLVPSHYSHETEKMLINEFGGTGLNSIDVTSFEKLARELLNGTEKKLSAPGKQSVICRAVELCIAELKRRHDEFDSRLTAAVSRRGFLDVALSLVSELHRYMVKSDELKAQAEKQENGILKQKLEITAMIAEKYDELLSSADYIDSDEDLIRLAEVAQDIFDSNTSIWIDKFDEFLPQQLEVVKSLIRSGIDITVTFNTCDDYSDTYYGTIDTISALKKFCEDEMRCPANIKRLNGTMRHLKNAPDLYFLFSTWFDRTKYDKPVQNAELFAARDTYTEIEHIAGRILDFVREENYRFRDISVICGNQDDYSHVIEAVFDEYKIPYYSDERVSISEHPIAMQILSLFDIADSNWSYDSVFRYLRAGFIYNKVEINGKTKYRRIPSGSIDLLENYVLKYGIRGRAMWSKSWSDGQKGIIEEAFGTESEASEKAIAAHENADKLREMIFTPIDAYCTAVKSAKTVNEYCRALYDFFESVNLYHGLKSELYGMTMNRAESDAQRFGQIWNLILDILDQVNTALGKYSVTHTEFEEYIRAAMTQCQIRTIPSGVDRVFIGTVEKNQAVNTKIMFMAGAVTGTFPSESVIEGFLSNADRKYLESVNIRLAPATTKKNAKQYNNVYKTLSSVTDKLCISYPVQTPEGRSCREAQTVLDIKKKLPDMRLYDDIIIAPENETKMYISSPDATLHRMLINNREHPLWKHVNSWFNDHEEWTDKLNAINIAKASFDSRNISLDEELARELYSGRIMYSATRLNAYADCPFLYFLQYGLRARERPEWELAATDTGSYVHELIRLFCETVDTDKELDWENLDDYKCNEIVNEIVEKTIKNLNDNDAKDKERISNIFRRLGKTVNSAVKTLRRSIVSGSFKISAYEKEINYEFPDNDNIGVRGMIDRLDVCEHDGMNEYRIIDYKTGNKEFKVSEIYNGYDMQPVIYALVMLEQEKTAAISGMYYSEVRNDFASIGTGGRKTTVQNQLAKNTCLNGVTFVDVDEDGAIKAESVDRVESEYARENGSLFFGNQIKLGNSVQSRSNGEQLIKKVRKNICDMDSEIRSGCIKLSPRRESNKHDSCKFCAYSAVCKFDEDLAEIRSISESDNEIWKRLEDEE